MCSGTCSGALSADPRQCCPPTPRLQRPVAPSELRRIIVMRHMFGAQNCRCSVHATSPRGRTPMKGMAFHSAGINKRRYAPSAELFRTQFPPSNDVAEHAADALPRAAGAGARRLARSVWCTHIAMSWYLQGSSINSPSCSAVLPLMKKKVDFSSSTLSNLATARAFISEETWHMSFISTRHQ